MSFSDHITDQVTPQIFIMAFEDRTEEFDLLTSIDGDFTTDPIEISRPYYADVNVQLGSACSSSISLTLQNTSQKFNGFGFGRALTYIGTKEDVEQEQGMTLGTYSIDITPSGLLLNNTYIQDADDVTAVYVYSLFGGTYYAYFVDDNDKVRRIELNDLTNDVVLGDPSDLFAFASTKHQIAALVVGDEIGDAFDYYVNDGSDTTHYELCPVGVFNIGRPRSTSTNTINITNAFDDMSLMDASCGSFISTIKAAHPSGHCSVQTFVDALLNDFTFPYYASWPNVEVRLDMFQREDYTYRELLKFALEAAAKNCYFDGTGSLEIKDPPSEPLQTPASPFRIIPKTQIAAGTYDRADYFSGYIDGVHLYKTNNTEWISLGAPATSKNIYVITGNPLIDENTLQDANFVNIVEHLPMYHPVTVQLTEFNPAIEQSATMSIQNIYTDQYELVPSWQIDIYWSGKTYAVVMANGEIYRNV